MSIGLGELLVVLAVVVVCVVLGGLLVVLGSRRLRRSHPGDPGTRTSIHQELQQDLHDQRQDIERREHRITEREQRLHEVGQQPETLRDHRGSRRQA